MNQKIAFLKSYKERLKTLLDALDFDKIAESISLLELCAKNKGVIYIIGNGGSAATASHMENDLAIGLKQREIVSFNIRSLGDNSSVCTAIANDIGYESIFYMQLKDILQSKDVLIAISCSGNSPNIIKAVDYANQIGSKVIGLTGFDGGDLKVKSDINIHVSTPKGEYGLVEDIHMIYDHMIYSYFIDKGEVNV
jgi:D-sedoheptulose 7-phosphate isomerase